MKKVFTGVLFSTLSLLLVGTMTAGAAGTLPGDTNLDGAVSCSEATQRATAHFNRMDADNDSFMTMAEFEAGTTKNFEAMDSDKSGMVDVQEYLVTWCGAPAKDAKPAKKATKGNKHSLHKNMDANKNGKVTSEECVAFWTVRFADIDGNNDNTISKDEFDKNVVEWYSIVDVNKDGSVTTVEFTDRWVGACQAEKLKKSLSKK
jgi:Ca2+-binding EF-hand superfamily protein